MIILRQTCSLTDLLFIYGNRYGLYIRFHTLSCQPHNRSHQPGPQDHGTGAVHRVHVAPMAATTFIQTLVRVFEAQELAFSLARVPWPGFEPGSFTTSS